MSATQFSTFWIDGKLYGVDIQLIQEITKTMPITPVPLAPSYIKGLINLRGQIATAIDLRELFKFSLSNASEKQVNVVCKSDSLLLSLVVDEVGDVLELSSDLYESTPETVSEEISRFMAGVYKLQDNILSVIDVKKIIEYLN